MNYEQWENTTRYLIPVLRNKIAKNEPREILDLWSQPCGTSGCVAGDCVIAMNFQSYNDKPPREHLLEAAAEDLLDRFENLFGFPEGGYIETDDGLIEVFGGPSYGTLDDRLVYVVEAINFYGHTETEFNKSACQ